MAVVMYVYVTSGAMKVLGLDSIGDWPSSIPESAWTK